MRILLDTNIIVRLVNGETPEHELVKETLGKLYANQDELFIVPQVLYEFWAVATRPTGAVNGLGYDVRQAEQELQRLQRLFTLLPDQPNIYPIWTGLVTAHQVLGRNSHDARIAAAGLAHGVTTLLTFNNPDFKRFGIQVLHPQDISKEAP